MDDQPPKSRPEPPKQPDDQSVYGGEWGQSGKQNPEDPAKAQSDPASSGPAPSPDAGGDRPQRLKGE